MKKVEINQIKILKKLNGLITKENNLDKNFSLKEYFYQITWANNYGSWILKNFLIKNKFYFKNVISFFKFILEYSKRDANKFTILGKVLKKNYKNLIITYTNNNKLKKKKLFDAPFNCTIENSKNNLWVLINFDQINHSLDIQENVLIFQKKKTFFYLNYFFYFSLIKNFFIILLFKKKLADSNLFCNFYSILDDIIKKNRISRVIIAYESQPFQHAIIKFLKIKIKNLKIIGYLHSNLPSLPTDFVYKKKYEPDKLIVHGFEQKNILIKYLGWTSKKILVKKSFRYKKRNKSEFQNKIFLSYSIGNPSEVFFKMRIVFKILSIDKNSYKIINHPYMGNSSRHLKLINLLSSLIIKNSTKNQQKFTFVVGVSAIIPEILENGQDVIQFCNDPLFEKHSETIWKNIISEEIYEGVYHYKLKKFGSLINFGRDNIFKKFLASN